MQENYLAKWLNNELSEEELAEFKKSAEYTSYKRIIEASSKIETPQFNADQAWTSIKSANEKEEEVLPLHPYKSFFG